MASTIVFSDMLDTVVSRDFFLLTTIFKAYQKLYDRHQNKKICFYHVDNLFLTLENGKYRLVGKVFVYVFFIFRDENKCESSFIFQKIII